MKSSSRSTPVSPRSICHVELPCRKGQRQRLRRQIEIFLAKAIKIAVQLAVVDEAVTQARRFNFPIRTAIWAGGDRRAIKSSIGLSGFCFFNAATVVVLDVNKSICPERKAVADKESDSNCFTCAFHRSELAALVSANRAQKQNGDRRLLPQSHALLSRQAGTQRQLAPPHGPSSS